MQQIYHDGDRDRRACHERRIQNIDRGDGACAVICAAPGLHGSESRHDEQAARNCKSAQVDRGAESERRCKYNGRTLRRVRRSHAKSGKPKVKCERPQ